MKMKNDSIKNKKEIYFNSNVVIDKICTNNKNHIMKYQNNDIFNLIKIYYKEDKIRNNNIIKKSLRIKNSIIEYNE